MTTGPDAPVPADTTPEAAALQRRLYCEMAPAERLGAALAMSVAVRRLARARLEAVVGESSERELQARLIEICYGVKLPW